MFLTLLILRWLALCEGVIESTVELGFSALASLACTSRKLRFGHSFL